MAELALLPPPALSTVDSTQPSPNGKPSGKPPKPRLTPRIVRVASIRRDEHQARQTPRSVEAAEQLAASVAQVGVLEPPIVRPGQTPDTFTLVVGDGRITAAEACGIEELLCLVTDGPIEPAEVSVLQWVENQQREGLNAIDQAKVFLELRRTHRWTQSQIAKALGVSQGHVSEYLDLLKLPGELQDRVAAGTLSIRGAKAAGERLKRGAAEPDEPPATTTPDASPFTGDEPLEGVTVHAAHSWSDSASRLMFVVGRRSKRPVSEVDVLRALKKRVAELERRAVASPAPAH